MEGGRNTECEMQSGAQRCGPGTSGILNLSAAEDASSAGVACSVPSCATSVTSLLLRKPPPESIPSVPGSKGTLAHERVGLCSVLKTFGIAGFLSTTATFPSAARRDAHARWNSQRHRRLRGLELWAGRGRTIDLRALEDEELEAEEDRGEAKRKDDSSMVRRRPEDGGGER